mgnify:CR=1 FL=1
MTHTRTAIGCYFRRLSVLAGVAASWLSYEAAFLALAGGRGSRERA